MIFPLPLLDFYGAPLTALLFMALFILQWKKPLRSQKLSVWRRTFINLAYSLPGFAVLRLVLVPLPYMAAVWAAENHFGALHWLHAPPILNAICGVIFFDYAYYWWHVATHKVPLLWRFHNVHHTDLDLDVGTAARFHAGEILLSVPFRMMWAVLTGIAPTSLLIFEICFECATQFHHSNWRLPKKVERALNFVFITPRLHGVHHSIVQREADSNWGTIFSVWDRIHRSRRAEISQSEITIGVPAWRDENELGAMGLWKMPFCAQRELALVQWRSANSQSVGARIKIVIKAETLLKSEDYQNRRTS